MGSLTAVGAWPYRRSIQCPVCESRVRPVQAESGGLRRWGFTEVRLIDHVQLVVKDLSGVVGASTKAVLGALGISMGGQGDGYVWWGRAGHLVG